jgi:hypothetical protein
MFAVVLAVGLRVLFGVLFGVLCSAVGSAEQFSKRSKFFVAKKKWKWKL